METTTEIVDKGYFPRSNGFLHICPECGKEFYGRKNKIFCSSEHKICANNRKASERKSRVGMQGRILEQNVQIIHEYCKEMTTPLKVEKEKLIKLGFVTNGPSVLLKASDNAYWSQIGNYVLGAGKNSNLISIMTLEDFTKF